MNRARFDERAALRAIDGGPGVAIHQKGDNAAISPERGIRPRRISGRNLSKSAVRLPFAAAGSRTRRWVGGLHRAGHRAGHSSVEITHPVNCERKRLLQAAARPLDPESGRRRRCARVRSDRGRRASRSVDERAVGVAAAVSDPRGVLLPVVSGNLDGRRQTDSLPADARLSTARSRPRSRRLHIHALEYARDRRRDLVVARPGALHGHEALRVACSHDRSPLRR